VEHRVDVTLSVHFNTIGPTGHDGIISFVHGCALPGEAAVASQRYWLVRRALEGSLDDSVALAGALIDGMRDRLGLDVLRPAPAEPFAPMLALDAERGVYARNLAVLRRAAGVAVLLEGPPVDHPDEYARLQDASVVIDGHGYPRRTLELAEGIMEGLRRFREGGSE
jgi:N-acetylmuramoyl-L-alanine amidase